METGNGNRAADLLTPRIAIAVVVAAFAISRAIYLWPGGRFTMNFYFMQFLDPHLLASNFSTSMLYLHSQPPIMNFMVGAAMKLLPSAPDSMTPAFQLTFAAMGLAIALLMLTLMTDLGVPRWLALAATVLFEVGPATLMYENWFYDTYPTIFLLCVSAFSLNRFITREKLAWGVAFIAAIALLVFLNTTFQFVWFIAAVLILWVAAPEKIRRLRSVALACLLLMLALYAKNALLFGVFTTSSWLGMNLSTMTTFQLPLEERQALVRDGKLSESALTVPFPDLPADSSPPTGISVLDQPVKMVWVRATNYNNLAYLHISRVYLHDALWVLRNRPAAYARGLAIAIEEYFHPAADVGDLFTIQKNGLGGWISVYDLPLATISTRLGYVRNRNAAEDRVGYGISIVLFVVLTLLSIWAAMRALRVVRFGAPTPEEITLLFIAITVLYIGLTGVALNCGENARLRFVTDPFYVILACIVLTELLGIGRKDRIANQHLTARDHITK